MKRRTKGIALLLIVGLMLTAVSLWRRIPREPQLWDLSQKITSTSGWSERYAHAQTEHTYYFWRNPTELLYFRNQGLVFQGYHLKLDGSHSNTELPGLQVPQNDFPLEVSPDGRLLLWLKSGGDPHYVDPRISLVDGPADQALTTPTSSLSPPTSSAQRRFRIVVTNASVRNRIMKEYLDTGKFYAIYGEPFFPPHIYSEEPLSPSSGKDPSPARSAISQSIPRTAASDNVFRVHWIVRSQKGPGIQHTLRIGKYASVENVCVSPDGNRIFFEENLPAQEPHPKWPSSLLIRLWPHKPTEKHVFVVADLATGRRKELATFETPYPNSNNPAQFEIHDVQWSPDGERLSFIYQQNLFTIPVK